MKKYLYNIMMVLAACSILLSAGCTDSFDEINTDPDNAKDVPATNLLAWSLWATSSYFYDRWFMLDEPGTFSAYAAKMNYVDESKYQFRPGVQDSNWTYIYRVLNNLRDIQARALEAGSQNMYNVARIMEAKVMLIATDRWRDVPYTDAIKIADGLLLPTYDRQEDIYPALLALLKSVADDMSAGYGTDDISGGDFLYWGDMDKWQKFCNSLRLRMAIRISGVSAALAKSTVEEILGNSSRYPVFESNDDAALFWWDGNDPTRYEPIGDAYRTRKTEFCASDVMVNYLLANADPRISIYFTPTQSSDDPEDEDYNDGKPLYRGYVIGAEVNGTARKLSVWGYKYGQDLGGVSPWLRASEVYFNIAEAAMLGYNTGGISAEDAYNKAIELSMEENDISASAAADYLAGAGKFTGQLKQIWYEQWVAMFKNGMEGWSLFRRTGVPETHYIAPGRANRYSNHNTPPFRSLYPDTERSLNKANNEPFDAEVVDDFWGKQMWWDTRTGVY